MNIKKIITGWSFLLFFLGACGSTGVSQNPKSVSDDSEVLEKTTVDFWHAMNGDKEEALTKLTDDFMQENPTIKIALHNQSSYDQLHEKLNITMGTPQNLPTMTQSYPGWLWDAMQDGLLVDLGPYTIDPDVGWNKEEAPKESLLDGAKLNGVQYGIPFNKSAEVLYYNPALLAKYSVSVPKSLSELVAVSKEIYEKSAGRVKGAGFDSLGNYYVFAMRNKGHEFTSDLSLTDQDSQDVIQYYAEGVKEGYFMIPGSEGTLQPAFFNEDLAMFVASSSSDIAVKKGSEDKFEYAVAPRPEPLNLQQGTDLYVFDSATPAQRKAAFLYMKYLASAPAQLYWGVHTGYMPILDSVLYSSEYQQQAQGKTHAVFSETAPNILSGQLYENADPAYAELDTIMAYILANSQENLETLIQDAAPQFQLSWDESL